MSDNSRNYSDAFRKNAADVMKSAFQIVLNFQTPWGEWGPGFYRNPEYLSDIERKGHVELGKIKDIDFPIKYGMSRTLRAMELLDKVNDERKYEPRIDLALSWIDERFNSKSWFRSYQLSIAEDKDGIKKMPIVDDSRHTVQAFIAFLLFKKNSFFSLEYKESIATIIKQGIKKGLFFTSKGENEPDFATSMWSIELMYRLLKIKLPSTYITKKQRRISFKRDIKIALNNSVIELIEFINKDSKHYIYRLCLLVIRITDVFIYTKREDFLEKAIRDIQNELVNGKFENNFKMHIYITFALLRAKKKGANINEFQFIEANHYIVDKFFENLYWMDTPEFIIISELLLEFKECREAVVEFDGVDYIINENIDSIVSTDVVYLLIERLYEIAVRIDQCKKGVRAEISCYPEHSSEDYEKIQKINDKITKLYKYMNTKNIFLYGPYWHSYPIVKMLKLPVVIKERYNRLKLKLVELCMNYPETLKKIGDNVKFIMELKDKL